MKPVRKGLGKDGGCQAKVVVGDVKIEALMFKMIFNISGPIRQTLHFIIIISKLVGRTLSCHMFC